MKHDPTLYNKKVLFQLSTKYANGYHTALIFIHGGAWVDPSNTSNDFKIMAETINDINLKSSNHNDNISLFGIEYRLSPLVKHPIHLQDVIININRLIQDYKINSLYLCGHSVGATLIWQILSDKSPQLAFLNKDLNSIHSKLAGIFLLDGIYSLHELLDEYADYNSFVSKAFDDIDIEYPDPKYDIIKSKDVLSHIDIHIIHSYNDELLTLRQTNYFVRYLEEVKIHFTLTVGEYGLHNDVFTNKEVAKLLYSNIFF